MIEASAAYLTQSNARAKTPIHQAVLRRRAESAATAYWKLDETSGTRLDSVGSNDLTDNATVTSAAGKFSTAAQFTAANSEYLSCAVDSGNVLTTGDFDFTVWAWVYMDSEPAIATIVSQRDNAVDNGWSLYYAADRFNFVVEDSNGQVSVTSNAFGALSIATWYFVAAWRDTLAGTINIQVNNGTVDSQATVRFAEASTEDFRIGAISSPAEYFWDGRIDEVGFINHSMLSAAILTSLYNGGGGLNFDYYVGSTIYLSTRHPSNRDDIGLEIMEPLFLESRTEIDFCRFPLTTLTFLLHDFDGTATALVSAGIVGLVCDFYSGFWPLEAQGNLIQRFSGIVAEVSFEDGVYQVTARSRMSPAQSKMIFNGGSTHLTAGISATATAIPVVDTSAFASLPLELLWGAGTGIIAIDDEVIITASKTATNITASSRLTLPYVVPPPLPGSIRATHGIDSVVRELIHMGRLTGTNDDGGTNDMHPIDYLDLILTSENAQFGIGGGVEANDEELAAARVALGAGLKFRFLFGDAISAKAFIESEIYLPCAAYPTEGADGRIGIKLFQGSDDAAFVDAITDDHVTSNPRWLRNSEKLINTVIYHYDHNPLTDEFMSVFKYTDETLKREHGMELPLTIYSKGIRASYTNAVGPLTWFADTAAFLVDAAQRHIERFGRVSPVISVDVLSTKNLLEVSDDIEATFDHVVDMATAESGITNAPMEVAAIRHNFRSGSVELELLRYSEESRFQAGNF